MVEGVPNNWLSYLIPIYITVPNKTKVDNKKTILAVYNTRASYIHYMYSTYIYFRVHRILQSDMSASDWVGFSKEFCKNIFNYGKNLLERSSSWKVIMIGLTYKSGLKVRFVPRITCNRLTAGWERMCL